MHHEPPDTSLLSVETAPCDAAGILYRVRDVLSILYYLECCQVFRQEI